MLPKPESGGDFLKADNLRPLLSKNKTARAKIVGDPKVGKYGVDVPVEIGREVFTLTLDPKFRDYRTVTEELSQDESDWEGHTLTLGLRKGLNKKGEESEYVQVRAVE